MLRGGEPPRRANAQSRAGTAVRVGSQAADLLSGTIVRGADYGTFGWYEVTSDGIARLDAAGTPYERFDRGTEIGINVYRFDPLVAEPDIERALKSAEPARTADVWLVQLVGPTKDEWLSAIADSGATIVQYHAEHSYAIWATPAQVDALSGAAFVRWIGRYHPADKVAPELRSRAGRLTVSALVLDAQLSEVRSAVAIAGGREMRSDPPAGITC